MHTGWCAPMCQSLQVHKSRLHHERIPHDMVRNLAAQRSLGVMFLGHMIEDVEQAVMSPRNCQEGNEILL
jgi:hypothetical protein